MRSRHSTPCVESPEPPVLSSRSTPDGGNRRDTDQVRAGPPQRSTARWCFVAALLFPSLALAAAQADVNRNKYMRDVTVKQAMNTCTGGPGFSGNDAQACQTAANAAQIETLSQQAFISDQLATQNRLKADPVAVQSAQMKAQLQEADERRSLLLTGPSGLDPMLTGQVGSATNVGVDMN